MTEQWGKKIVLTVVSEKINFSYSAIYSVKIFAAVFSSFPRAFLSFFFKITC